MPACPAHRFTAYQTTFAVTPEDCTIPPFRTCLNTLPSVTPECRSQASTSSLDHDGTGTVRSRAPLPTKFTMTQDDPESYEIPKLEQDLPPCLADKRRSDTVRPLTSFPVPNIPRLKDLVETTIELQRISHSIERPKVDEDWLESERSYHSLDLALPAVLLYFRAGDAVMACFDDECEHWGQETSEPNLIIPLRADDHASVRQALAVVETLMQVLFSRCGSKTSSRAGRNPRAIECRCLWSAVCFDSGLQYLQQLHAR